MRNWNYPFVDELGRPSDKPNTLEYGITDNPHLFIGQIALLKAELGELSFEDVSFMDEILTSCRVSKGVFNRHPKWFMEKYPWTVNKMSHDELNGLAFMASASPVMLTYFLEVMEYLHNNDRYYYDLVPGSNYKRAIRKYSFIERMKLLYNYWRDLRANKNNTNAVDLRHDGDIVSITTYKSSRDMSFYDIVYTASLGLELRNMPNNPIMLILATLFTLRRGLEDGSRGGTMLMVWFRNVALSRLLRYQQGTSVSLIKTTIKIFNKVMTLKYGKKFPVVLINRYFDLKSDSGQKNPMINLVERYVDLKGV